MPNHDTVDELAALHNETGLQPAPIFDLRLGKTHFTGQVVDITKS